VKRGQVLVRIDSSQLEAKVVGLQAGSESARASLEQAKANLERAQRTYDRQTNMHKQKLVSESEYEATLQARDNAIAAERVARAQLAQAQAALQEADYTLSKYTILAPMGGILTRKEIEPGEMAVAGTLSVPGTLLMTIADLSVMEVEIEVDEIDVVHVRVGQKAEVEVDAYPDRTWAGEVTEVGTSALLKPLEQAKTFRVVITLAEGAEELKPGLSASASIVTATRDEALSIPIQALTVRSADDLAEDNPAHSASGSARSKELEGAFLFEEGSAHFRPVKVGIAGELHFEVLEGLAEGQSVVTGPYETLRKLSDGERVREKGKDEGRTPRGGGS
jgi:HlyD family secretion protein